MYPSDLHKITYKTLFKEYNQEESEGMLLLNTIRKGKYVLLPRLFFILYRYHLYPDTEEMRIFIIERSQRAILSY